MPDHSVNPSLLSVYRSDEYPKVTQADLDRAQFRVGLKPAPRKRRVTILLDTGLIEYFKAKAGDRGYQTLINETLRQAIERDDMEERLRRIVREELRGAVQTTAVVAEANEEYEVGQGS